MNLAELKFQCAELAKRRSLTLEGFLGEFGIAKRSLNHAITSGRPLELVNAAKLLPVIAAIVPAGQVVELECALPDGSRVFISPASHHVPAPAGPAFLPN